MATLSNYRLDGYCDFALNYIYEHDLANTKSEAMRIAIRDYAKKVGVPGEQDYLEQIAVAKKFHEIEEGIKSGKIKTYTKKEYLKTHPEAKAYLG